MSARLLAELERAGVSLYLGDGQLRARARPGTLTESIRETIAAHREALIAELEAIDATVRCILAQPIDVQDAWRREVVAWQRWEEAGHPPEPNQAHDLCALRRIVPAGVCLDCGGPAPYDGRCWCAACERKPGSQLNGGV
jgi:hypothetical protein